MYPLFLFLSLSQLTDRDLTVVLRNCFQTVCCATIWWPPRRELKARPTRYMYM